MIENKGTNKNLLKEHEIAYTDYDCEENVKYAEEVWNLTGKQSTPTRRGICSLSHYPEFVSLN
ncbi:hypothetical protein YDYSG_61340 [Paenibacillus tyrfis]|nr:hypothetical protein YDYSG_61340 [Paenibacillus tyrfis]